MCVIVRVLYVGGYAWYLYKYEDVYNAKSRHTYINIS